jgi:hypothetical protein
MVKCGSDPTSFQNWIDNNVIPMALSGRYTLLLPFNEPDNQNQCDGIMTVDEAVALWPMLEEVPLPLASPATAGDDWLDEFMLEVERLDLRVDFIAYHWYGRPEWWRPMNKLTRVHDEHQRPMIITEIAPGWWPSNDYTPDQALWFAKNVLPWLEEQEWIAGYAWFPFHPDNPAGGFSALFDSDTGTALTCVGEFYASVTNENPQGDQSISCE